MSRLQDVLLRGTAGSRPAAGSVPVGTLYFSTDTLVIEQSDGTTWNTYSGVSGGGGSSITTIVGIPGLDAEEPLEPLMIPGPSGSSASLTTAQKTRQIGVVIDGGGSAITTGIKGRRSFPVAGTITGVRMLADQSGSAVIDIWKDTYANYPPTVADTITASAKPTISAATKSEDTTLTGWTITVNAGDTFIFNVDSATTITWLILELTIVIT